MDIPPARVEKKELIMAKLNKTRTIAAALLGTAVLGAPITSFAQDFRSNSSSFVNCQTDTRNNQVVGGLVGAVAGGVLGSQIAGRGDRTEGSIIGAALGGVAGASIAGNQNNCNTRTGFVQTGFNSSRSQNFGTTTRFISNPVVTRSHSNRGFGSRTITQTASFGHSNRRIELRLNQIDREIYATDAKIEKLVHEEKLLKKKLRLTRNTRQIKYRLLEIDNKIALLKDCKHDLKLEARKLKGGRY